MPDRLWVGPSQSEQFLSIQSEAGAVPLRDLSESEWEHYGLEGSVAEHFWRAVPPVDPQPVDYQGEGNSYEGETQ